MIEILKYLKDASMRKQIFIYGLFISYILFFITLFGIGKNNERYYTILRDILKYYVCIFLIVKFNPYSNSRIKFDYIDRFIVFHSGIFLLITTGAVKFIENYIEDKTKVNLPIN